MSVLRDFFVIPFEVFYEYRELIWYQIKAEFKQKHFQKVLGPLWWFGEPLLLAVMYVFITTVLFRYSMGEHHTFSVVMGVLVWTWFARSVGGAPNLLVGFRTTLTRTNLPILPLVLSHFLFQLIIFGFSMIVIIVGMIISGVDFTGYILFLPILIIVQFTITVAIATNVAKIGIFFRDISGVVSILVHIWFYLSPIIYLRFVVPDEYRFYYELNPFATIFPAWRDVLINGELPDLVGLGILFVIFLPLAFFGLRSIAINRAQYFKRL